MAGYRYALERVSPLLASVASMEQGEQVVMSFSPEGMHWPANFVKVIKVSLDMPYSIQLGLHSKRTVVKEHSVKAAEM